MIPLLDDPEEVEYYWYVGDPVPTVGLYKRTGRYETPIYQNTRGKGVFVGAEVDVGNVDETEPTGAFWEALDKIVNGDEGIEVSETEWYENEFLYELLAIAEDTDADDLPTEIGQLFAQVDDGREGQG